ncbi:BON domain-containing protein [Myxococcaceae bacterium JPH2]|nr:BON domain-containing protein [Myxococcaceae bacterium JPH2]
MSGRHHDGKRKRGHDPKGRKHEQPKEGLPGGWEAARAGGPLAHESPLLGRAHRDAAHYLDDARDDARARRIHAGDWDSDPDRQGESRDFAWDRDDRYLARDTDTREFDLDQDFHVAAQDLDRARPPPRHFDPYRERDRRAREFDPERSLRRPGFSPSGSFHELPPEPLPERPRRGPPRRPRGGPPLPEQDVRFGGTEAGPHGPGRENMAPPQMGYWTSPSRPQDHELGHGGYLGRGHVPRPAGRGPRGYTRSDSRIREEICERLMREWMDASEVEVHVEAGEVTLRGTVSSRDEKRAIEDVADGELGVKDIHNHLRIREAGHAAGTSTSQAPEDAHPHSS